MIQFGKKVKADSKYVKEIPHTKSNLKYEKNLSFDMAHKCIQNKSKMFFQKGFWKWPSAFFYPTNIRVNFKSKLKMKHVF